KAAQVVLVRLAVAAVLADDDSRHELEHFAGPQRRALFDHLARRRTFARRVGVADAVVAVAFDDDGVEHWLRRLVGMRLRHAQGCTCREKWQRRLHHWKMTGLLERR